MPELRYSEKGTGAYFKGTGAIQKVPEELKSGTGANLNILILHFLESFCGLIG